VTARHALARAAALGVVAAVALVACGKRDVPERFGREMVLGTSLPADAIERFNAFVPAPRKPGTSAIDALAADTESWRAASEVTVSANANPYVVVLRVTGRGTGDDGAVTLWLAGFERREKPGGAPFTMTRPIPGLNAPKGGAKGDGRFERVGASGGVSFREDEVVHPVVEIQRRAGLAIERVDVEVWSGLPNPTWREMLFGWQGALVGVFMFVFWWFAFRRRG